MINKAACFIRMSHMCMQTVEGYMVCDKEALHPFKKERGIRPLTVKLGIAFRSDMSSKEISLVCKKN